MLHLNCQNNVTTRTINPFVPLTSNYSLFLSINKKRPPKKSCMRKCQHQIRGKLFSCCNCSEWATLPSWFGLPWLDRFIVSSACEIKLNKSWNYHNFCIFSSQKFKGFFSARILYFKLYFKYIIFVVLLFVSLCPSDINLKALEPTN